MAQHTVTARAHGTAGLDSPLAWSQLNASPSPVSSSDISCAGRHPTLDIAMETGGSLLGVTTNQLGKTSHSRLAISESIHRKDLDESVGMAAAPVVPINDSAIAVAGPLASVKAGHNRIRAVPKKRKYEEFKAARGCTEGQKNSIPSDCDDVPTPPTSYDCLQSERLLNGSPIKYVESISSANLSSEDSDDLRDSPKPGDCRDKFEWQQVAKSLMPMLGFLNPRLGSSNLDSRQPEKPPGLIGTATAFKSVQLPAAIRAPEISSCAVQIMSKPNDPIVDLSKRLIETLESQLKDHRSSDYPDENLFVQSLVAVLCRTFVDLCDAKSTLRANTNGVTNDNRSNADVYTPARKISRVETADLPAAGDSNDQSRKRRDRLSQQISDRVANTGKTGPAGSSGVMPETAQRVFASQPEALRDLAQANSGLTPSQIYVPEAVYPYQTQRSNEHQKTRFAKYSPSRTGHWCATHVTVANYLKNCQLESNIGSKLPTALSGTKSISELFEGALKDALKITPRDKSHRANCKLSEEGNPHAVRSIYPSAEDCLLSLPLPIPIPLSFMRRIENNSPHRIGLQSDQRDKQKPLENGMLRETTLSSTGSNRRQEGACSGWMMQSPRLNEPATTTISRSDDVRRQECNNYLACYRESSQHFGYTQDANAADDRLSYRSQPTTCANRQTIAAPDTGSSFRTPLNVTSVNRNMTSTLSLRYSATEYHRKSLGQSNPGSANQHPIHLMDTRTPATQEIRGAPHHYLSNGMQQASDIVQEHRQLHVNASSERLVRPESRFMPYGNNSSLNLLHLHERLAPRTSADQLAPHGPMKLAQKNQQAMQTASRLFHNRPWADLHAPLASVPSNPHNSLNAPHNTAVTPYMV